MLSAMSNLMDEKILVMSNLIDEKSKPIIMMQENEILPRLQNIEGCYTDTFRGVTS